MWQMLIGPISNLLGGVLDKIFPDPIKKAEVQGQIMTELLKVDASTFENQIKPLLAELSGNWLQRSWRPILMLSIVAIVVNNYIVYPYLSLFGVPSIVLTLPDKLWSLMEIGVGGYIVGRSAEKVIQNYKQGGGG
jgi:hypothetical protein